MPKVPVHNPRGSGQDQDQEARPYLSLNRRLNRRFNQKKMVEVAKVKMPIAAAKCLLLRPSLHLMAPKKQVRFVLQFQDSFSISAFLGSQQATVKSKGRKGGVNTKSVEYDAMGSKWPSKQMWDNMENYWRIVMSNEEFEVTPGCYDRQLDSTYRASQETVTYGLLEEARAKCMKWIIENKDHFSL